MAAVEKLAQEVGMTRACRSLGLARASVYRWWGCQVNCVTILRTGTLSLNIMTN